MRYVRLLYIAQQEQRPSSTASSSTSHNKNTDSNSSSQCNRLHQYHRRQPLLPFSSSVKIDPEAHVVETSTNPHASKPAMAVLSLNLDVRVMRYVRLLYIAQQEQRPSSTASSSTSHNKNTDSNSSSQCNRLHQYHRRQPLLPFSSSVKIDPAGKHITNTDSVFSYSEEAHVVETSTNPHASKPAMAVLRYTSMYMLLLVVTLVQYFFTSGSSPGYVVYAMREYARTEASLRASEISKNGGIGFGTCNRPIMLKDSAAGGIFGKLLKTGVGSRPRGSYASIKKSNKRGCFVSSSKPSVGGIFGKSGVVFFNFV
ncbi:hypothetical protein LXL04_034560 [Taraxacum kok-saghyz]